MSVVFKFSRKPSQLTRLPADQYPSAEVLGIDLAPMQPNCVPPNCRFLLDDMEDDWDYEKNPFDYIHARFLAASINDWPRLVKQAYKYVPSQKRIPSRFHQVDCANDI